VHKAILGLGFFLLIACSGQSASDDSKSGAAAASGEEANGGSGDTDSGGTGSGARSGAAGTDTSGAGGASPTGGSSSGGTAMGGSSASGGDGTGEGGEAGADNGGAGGTAGSSGATAGATGGQSAGTGGSSPTDAECDPAQGALEATPYPDCEPRDLTDSCELCIQAECCAEAKICYGYEPGNVCGWGGPTSGDYAGLNEIDCYVTCVRDYVTEYGAYDDGADIGCIPACTTPSCGLIGNATQDLVVCLRAHCEDDCFVP
jgi:hypothetical protein